MLARNRRQRIAFGLMIAMLCIAAGAGAATATKPVTIHLWGMVEQDMFEGWGDALREYEQKHPEVHIDRGSPGGQEAMDPQKLMTAFVSGKPPDLILMDRFQLAGWAARGVFRPLDDLYARDHIDRADLYPATLDECIQTSRTYGLPWYTDSRALWCNMDLLEKAGIKEPPRTWGELAAMNPRLTERTPQGRYLQVGFMPMDGNAWLYLYGWGNGGEFMSPDGRQCTLADPRIVGALEWMKRCYDLIGGAPATEEFRSAAQGEGAAEPFRAGKIALRITENNGLDYLAKYVADFNLRVEAPPTAPGQKTVSWAGGFCWSIPQGAAHVDEAWEIAKFLCSTEAWDRAGHFQSLANNRRARSEGLARAYYVPMISCSRKVNTEQVARFSGDLPAKIAEAWKAHIALVDVCRYRPVTVVGKELWDEQARATWAVLSNGQDPRAALEFGQRRVQRELDAALATRDGAAGPPFPLARVFWWCFGACCLVGAGVWARAARRWQWSARRTAEAKAGVLFALPALIGFFVLTFGPMLASLIMAFTRYDAVNPAHWTGGGNFARLAGFIRNDEGQIVASDPVFWRSFRNTALATIIGVPLSLLLSLALALLVSREVRGIRIYRMLLYLPVVVPAVAGAVLWIWLLSDEAGVNGLVLTPILNKLHLPGISFFSDPKFALGGLILLMLWGVGAQMVIFLAGVKGIPRSYYEAAAMDGAGPWQQFQSVTLPMLSPYIFFNLIMGIIAWVQIFVQPYVFITPPGFGPGDSMLYYMIYLFTQAFRYFNVGAACAMAWIMFVIIAVLTLVQFRLAPRWVHHEA